MQPGAGDWEAPLEMVSVEMGLGGHLPPDAQPSALPTAALGQALSCSLRSLAEPSREEGPLGVTQSPACTFPACPGPPSLGKQPQAFSAAVFQKSVPVWQSKYGQAERQHLAKQHQAPQSSFFLVFSLTFSTGLQPRMCPAFVPSVPPHRPPHPWCLGFPER